MRARQFGGGPANLLPFTTREQPTASDSVAYGMRPHDRSRICSPLRSICGASVCATGAQIIKFDRKSEAPPGFEPGMEVLQGHPRWFSRDRLERRSRQITHVQSITSIHCSRASCVPLVRIGTLRIAAGTVRAQLESSASLTQGDYARSASLASRAPRSGTSPMRALGTPTLAVVQHARGIDARRASGR
jgi:hypothetical protein